jgi:futalosine hydrolase
MGTLRGEASPGLVCAATWMELETFGMENAEVLEAGLYRIPEGLAAVTGVGSPMTLLRLVPWLERFRPAWIAVTGIAGAYADSGLKVGEVVVGESDVFADLGMEMQDGQGAGFAPLADFSFADEAHRAALPLWVPAWATATSAAKRGRGATVNRCTGTEATGAQRRALFGADFETMEGAAVALAARAPRIPVLQVRAISNIAARRDMRPENVTAALDSLRAFWAAHRGDLS